MGYDAQKHFEVLQELEEMIRYLVTDERIELIGYIQRNFGSLPEQPWLGEEE